MYRCMDFKCALDMRGIIRNCTKFQTRGSVTYTPCRLLVQSSELVAHIKENLNERFDLKKKKGESRLDSSGSGWQQMGWMSL
jgi:hypothetical protein